MAKQAFVKRSLGQTWHFLAIPLCLLLGLAQPVVAQLEPCPKTVDVDSAHGSCEDLGGGERRWILENDNWRQQLNLEITEGKHTLLTTDFTHKSTLSGDLNWTPADDDQQKHFRAAVSAPVNCLPDGFPAPGPADDFKYRDRYHLLGVDSADEEYVELMVGMQCEDEFGEDVYALRLFYRAHTDGVLETFAEIENIASAPLQLGSLSSFYRVFDDAGSLGPNPRYRWIEYVGDHPHLQDSTVFSFDDADHLFPFFSVYGDQDGLFGVLAPVGQDRAHFINLSEPPYVMHVGAHESTLLPGVGATNGAGIFRSATTYFKFFDGSTDSLTSLTRMGDVAQSFQLNRYEAPDDPQFPRVQFNNYFKDDLTFDFYTLVDESYRAGELGVERFVIDAAWSQGSAWSYEIDEESPCYAGGGHWFGNECRFPNESGEGFEYLLEAVFPYDGLASGLWVYPFVADKTFRDWSDPNPYGPVCWSASPPNFCFCPGPHCSPWADSWTTNVTPHGGTCVFDVDEVCGLPLVEDGVAEFHELCSSYTPSHDWVKSMMDHLIADYDTSYLKIDGGKLHCTRGREHDDHLTAERVYESNHQGQFRMLDELKALHPSLVIEAEWLLGHVAFLEDPWFSATVQAWETRYGKESARWFTPSQFTGNYLYGPPDKDALCTNSPITGTEICDPADGRMMSTPFRKYWIRSRMLGGFAISSDIASWDSIAPGFRNLVREHVQYFKDNRQFYAGPSYTLISQHADCGETGPCIDSWDAVEFLDEFAEQALVFAFRNASADTSRQLQLRGLDEDKDYRIIRSETPDTTIYTGAALMNGYSLALADEWTSEAMLVVKWLPPTLNSVTTAADCPKEQVDVSWTGPGIVNVEEYRIYRSYWSANGPWELRDSTPPSELTTTDTLEWYDTTYWYKVATVYEGFESDSNVISYTSYDDTDVDGDGVGSTCDNCIWVFNPDQEEDPQDLDDVGEACECDVQADCDDNNACTLDLCLKKPSPRGSPKPGQCKHVDTCP